MNKVNLLNKYFEDEKSVLIKAINAAKRERDSATSAMESHHDTTRNQAEKLVVALEEKLENLKKFKSSIPQFLKDMNTPSLWSYIEIVIAENKMQLMLVPDGIGGKELDKIRFVSIESPLGKTLINKKVGDTLTFNNKPIQILKIE